MIPENPDMKLFYFTASYPYGLGEIWKKNELKELMHHFKEITVVPFFYGDNFDHPKPLQPGVKLEGPLFRVGGWPLKKKDLLTIFFHPKVNLFVQEFFQKKLYLNKKQLLTWLSDTMTAIRLLKHPVIKKIIQEADQQTILYFFWGKGACEFLPFIDCSRFYKVFVRMHNYDLFETKDNYIPYRHALLKNISIAAPSSLAGKQHMVALHPEFENKIKIFRLGTIGNGKKSEMSQDNILRVVSCSYLSPVKRVHIMIECLQYIDFPILWRHVGDGMLRNEMDALIEKYAAHEKFIIEGMINSDKVLDFYTENIFDIFVNVSSAEGVPFSIMEAFSVSIPVIATDVGGNGEIVDDAVGKLLPADTSPLQLANALKNYYALSMEEKIKIRENAYDRSARECDATKLANELAVYLKS